MKNRIRILLLTQDDKFFGDIFTRFTNDERFITKAGVIVDSPVTKFAKEGPNVAILNNKRTVKAFLQQSKYDVLYIFPFPATTWWIINFIPKEKKVIWWGWGYDLYSSFYKATPLIDIENFKPITKNFVKQVSPYRGVIGFFRKLKDYPQRCKINYIRRKVLSRIDYFQPVVETEYHLLREQYSCFNAKLFYYKQNIPIPPITSSNNKLGDILIGNSSITYNNHCDIWERVKDIEVNGRKFILPMNYGDIKYRDYVEANIRLSHNQSVLILKDFLPAEKYWSLLKNCSYAIFGHIRQQALGNVSYCLNNGIKIFLYKDSIMYKFLHDYGFHVFTIEEIDDDSLSVPLTREQANHNCSIQIAWFRSKDKIFESCVNELLEL